MSVTQGQLSGAPSRPAVPAASAVNENCSSLPASPELPEQAMSPLGSVRSPPENSPLGLGARALDLEGGLSGASVSLPVKEEGKLAVPWGSSQPLVASRPLSHIVHQPVFGMGLRCHIC